MKPHRVLFIGNSYTHCNDLPRMVRALAASAGLQVETEHLTPGGWTFENHFYHFKTREKLNEGGWDSVVLQEQSTRPIDDPEKMFTYGVRLSEWIREVGASPVLYMTWSRTHIPESQELLTSSYRRLASQIDANIAPAGPAWHHALATDASLQFYVDDGSHPSFIGSYLSACTLMSTLFDVSPVGLTRSIPQDNNVTYTIDEPIAEILQAAAWRAVDEEKAYSNQS